MLLICLIKLSVSSSCLYLAHDHSMCGTGWQVTGTVGEEVLSELLHQALSYSD